MLRWQDNQTFPELTEKQHQALELHRSRNWLLGEIEIFSNRKHAAEAVADFKRRLALVDERIAKLEQE